MTAERVTAGIAALVMARFALAARRRASRRHGALADPLTVFLWVWAAAVGLFALPVIRYTPLGTHAWALIYGSIITFAAGCLLVEHRWGAPSPDDRPEDRKLAVDSERLPFVWAVAVVLGLIGFATFLRAAAEVVGLSTALTDPATLRSARAAGPLFDDLYGPGKILTYFNQVAFVLWTVGLRLGAFRGRWRWARLIGVISIVPFLFTADRGVMAATVAWAGMLHLLWPGVVNRRRVLQIGAVGFVIAWVVFLTLGSRYGSYLDGHAEIAAVANIHRPGQAVMGYLYVTGNLPTFAQLTGDPVAPLTYGQMTVLPLVKAAHAAGLSGTPPVGTGVFYPIPFESFSNYGWLGTFWLDFRDLGVLGLPFLVGALATALFRSYWRRPSIGWLWALSMLMLVIAFSPLANELSTTFTWEHLALAPVLGIALAAGRRAYAPTRRMVLAAAVLAMLGVAGLAAVRQSRGDPARPDAGSELIAAAVDAHVAFSTEGQYPSTKPLVSRLQVSNPAMDIRPLYTIDDPVPRAPAIGVLSNPYDVYFRTRTRDGRVLELHRIERFGGLTFGPGSRDG